MVQPSVLIPHLDHFVGPFGTPAVRMYLVGEVLQNHRKAQAVRQLFDHGEVVLSAQQEIGEGPVDRLLPGQLVDPKIDDPGVNLRRDLDERNLAPAM